MLYKSDCMWQVDVRLGQQLWQINSLIGTTHTVPLYVYPCRSNVVVGCVIITSHLPVPSCHSACACLCTLLSGLAGRCFIWPVCIRSVQMQLELPASPLKSTYCIIKCQPWNEECCLVLFCWCGTLINKATCRFRFCFWSSFLLLQQFKHGHVHVCIY